MSSSHQLERGTVALWYARVPKSRLTEPTSSFQRQLDILSDDEAARAKRYLFAEPRNRFILARYMLRQILGQYCGIDAERVALGTTANEKPILLDSAQVEFNVSHSNELIAVAVALRDPVGVDVEALDFTRDWQLIVKHQLHVDEQAWLQRQPEADRPAGFYAIWTAKEAYLKGLGVGLGHPLNGFAILPETALSRPTPQLDAAGDWCVQHAHLFDDYAVAVAGLGQFQILKLRFEI